MNKKYTGILFIIYLLILLLATIAPWSTSHKVALEGFEFRLDYFLHLAAYFSLAVLYFLWQFDVFVNIRILRMFLHVFLLLIFSFSTEAIQLCLPYRIFNYKDFIANSMGIFAGAGLFIVFRNPLLNLHIRYLNYKK